MKNAISIDSLPQLHTSKQPGSPIPAPLTTPLIDFPISSLPRLYVPISPLSTTPFSSPSLKALEDDGFGGKLIDDNEIDNSSNEVYIWFCSYYWFLKI